MSMIISKIPLKQSFYKVLNYQIIENIFFFKYFVILIFYSNIIFIFYKRLIVLLSTSIFKFPNTDELRTNFNRLNKLQNKDNI